MSGRTYVCVRVPGCVRVLSARACTSRLEDCACLSPCVGDRYAPSFLSSLRSSSHSVATLSAGSRVCVYRVWRSVQVVACFLHDCFLHSLSLLLPCSSLWYYLHLLLRSYRSSLVSRYASGSLSSLSQVLVPRTFRSFLSLYSVYLFTY